MLVEAGIIRTPGILAGLNERSQSAYAAPAPKPVERAIGHALPICRERMALCVSSLERYGRGGTDARLKSMTEAITPMLKPTPL